MSKRKPPSTKPPRLWAGSRTSKLLALIDAEPRTLPEAVEAMQAPYETIKRRLMFLEARGLVFRVGTKKIPNARGFVQQRAVFGSDPKARALAEQQALEAKRAEDLAAEQREVVRRAPPLFVVRAMKSRHPLELAWAGQLRASA